MNLDWLCQIDPSVSRRGAFADLVAASGLRLIEERSLAAAPPERGAVLVHDAGDAIARFAADCQRRGHWPAILGYREQPDPHAIVDAIEAGAADYFAWPIDIPALVARIEAREVEIANRTSRLRTVSRAREKINTLTPRERDALLAIARGASDKHAARSLGISHRTLEIHKAHMRGKMGGITTSDAVALAHVAGLIDED